MNFIEAAVILLRESGEPMHVEELCELALERRLLSRPGNNPLRSMKGRLTSEAKRAGSLLARVGDDLWTLAEGSSQEDAIVATDDDLEPESDGDELDDEEDAGSGLDDDDSDDDHSDVAVRANHEDDDADESEDEDEADLRADSDSDETGDSEDSYDNSEELDDDDSDDEASVEAPRELSPEEQELSRLYGTDYESNVAIADLAEYRDQQSQDEDRQLAPEIRAERRGRRDRGDRPEGRGRSERRDRSEGRTRRGRNERSGRPSNRSARTDGDISGSLAERAIAVLGGSRDSQGVRARQLVEMMRKRELANGDAEVLTQQIRAALLAEEGFDRSRGLRPRTVHRGRDLFAAVLPRENSLRAAEQGLANAVSVLEQATRRALSGRLSSLAPSAFERVAELYLERSGYRNIESIKCLDSVSYGLAVPIHGDAPTLIGARVGNGPVDRRGVGELRAGVAAKGARRGLLLAAQPLSKDAHAELEKEGALVEVMCGPPLMDALIALGIGALRLAAPALYLDTAFFEELGSR